MKLNLDITFKPVRWMEVADNCSVCNHRTMHKYVGVKVWQQDDASPLTAALVVLCMRCSTVFERIAYEDVSATIVTLQGEAVLP